MRVSELQFVSSLFCTSPFPFPLIPDKKCWLTWSSRPCSSYESNQSLINAVNRDSSPHGIVVEISGEIPVCHIVRCRGYLIIMNRFVFVHLCAKSNLQILFKSPGVPSLFWKSSSLEKHFHARLINSLYGLPEKYTEHRRDSFWKSPFYNPRNSTGLKSNLTLIETRNLHISCFCRNILFNVQIDEFSLVSC